MRIMSDKEKLVEIQEFINKTIVKLEELGELENYDNDEVVEKIYNDLQDMEVDLEFALENGVIGEEVEE